MTDTINEPRPLVVLTDIQLAQLVRQAVSQELQSFQPQTTEPPKTDLINIIDAASFLQELGCFIAKGTIYNLVAREAIPFRKIGRRVVFSRTDLCAWVEDKMKRKESYSEAALAVAESSRRKK